MASLSELKARNLAYFISYFHLCDICDCHV